MIQKAMNLTTDLIRPPASATDEWRRSPSGDKRPPTREAHDDLGLEVGQVWVCPPRPWFFRRQFIRIERVARRSVMAVSLDDPPWEGWKRQVSFLELRRDWRRM